MEKQLAKSLHTISVLVNMTRWLMATIDNDGAELSADEAMKLTLSILKLEGKADVYSLVATALKQINGK